MIKDGPHILGMFFSLMRSHFAATDDLIDTTVIIGQITILTGTDL